MGDKVGIKVTVEDLETGETASRVLVDDVLVLVTGTCYVDGVQDYPTSGTQVWTVKGRKGLGGK